MMLIPAVRPNHNGKVVGCTAKAVGWGKSAKLCRAEGEQSGDESLLVLQATTPFHITNSLIH